MGLSASRYNMEISSQQCILNYNFKLFVFRTMLKRHNKRILSYPLLPDRFSDDLYKSVIDCDSRDVLDREKVKPLWNYKEETTILTIFQTSPAIYVFAVQIFWKQWEKEKLLITSNFPFSHSVFYPFGELSAIFIKSEIVVCKPFPFESKIAVQIKGLQVFKSRFVIHT